MNKPQISIEQVIELIPAKTQLIYVDRSDNLNEHHSEIEDCIHAGNYDVLEAIVHEGYEEYLGAMEYQCYLEDLRKDIAKTFSVSKEDAKAITERYYNEISDTIYDRRTDNPVADLLRHTSVIVAHFNTGFDVSPYIEPEEFDSVISKLKVFLQIESDKYDSALRELIEDAPYGGKVRVYFEIEDAYAFIGGEKDSLIKFRGAPNIGIVCHINGAGAVTRLEGHEFSLPYDKKKVRLEKCIKWNWTYEIAGMAANWCSSTDYVWTPTPTPTP